MHTDLILCFIFLKIVIWGPSKLLKTQSRFNTCIFVVLVLMAFWTALPLDVLGDIAMKMETIEDFIYFSAVCRTWNHVSTLMKHQWRPIPVPWLLLAENTHENPSCVRKIFNLSNNKSYQLRLPETFGTRCWGSAYGWIAMVGSGFTCQLFNPLTKASISFPTLKTIVTDPCEDEEYIRWFLACYLFKVIVLKVSQYDHDEFVIMVLYEDGKAAVFARHGDQSWTPVQVRESVTGARMVDVVLLKKYVFALYDDGEIWVWNIEEFHRLELVKPMRYSPTTSVIYATFKETGADSIYMVESGRFGLLMVLRYKVDLRNSVDDGSDADCVPPTHYFEVYIHHPKEKRWIEIDDLGDMALFVGGNASMSVSVADATSLQRSCVYFTDDDYDYWEMRGKPTAKNMGVYDLKNDKVRQFYEGDDTFSEFCPPTLFIPQL